MGLITNKTLETLRQQEEILRYRDAFGAHEALSLGNTLCRLAAEYDRGITVEIFRESDGMVLFAWSADDKAPRNYGFVAGKRAAALKSGHASPWAQVEAAAHGEDVKALFSDPACAPAAGAFPIRVGDTWEATLVVSGLHDGLDHELCVRALEAELGVQAPTLTEALI